MTRPSVSVIVVSLNRPAHLTRCMAGIAQLDHPEFEVVVVADRAGQAALQTAGLLPRIKFSAFDTPNISMARNTGLAEAAGEVVAFIDDDAVPEPSWLAHLTQPFQDISVIAAGGYVRGRNGISFQRRASTVNRQGQAELLALADEAPAVLTSEPDKAIKTEGTNCAFRRQTLCEIGGFDPCFAFFMDETDVNLRLAALRARTAVVPCAQVHHGFAASRQRRSDRVPRSLADVGASTAVLMRKHAPDTNAADVWARLVSEQRARLLRHMVRGTCEPRDVNRLMADLAAGWTDGLSRPIQALPPIRPTTQAFKPFVADPPFSGDEVLAGRSWQARHLRAQAARRVAAGRRVSLFLFSPTALYHRVQFTEDGVWEQRGGLFGRSDREQPLFTFASFGKRLQAEIERLKGIRQLELERHALL